MQEKREQDYLVEKLKNDYKVPHGEEHLYHVIVEVKHFNDRTGVRESKPYVQKFGQKAFDTSVRSNLTKQGYTLTVIHDPHAWREQRAAESAQQAEQAAAEERARLKAELRAEIEAEIEAEQAAVQNAATEEKRTRKPRTEVEESKAE